jgi:hypothetical protein
VSPFFKRSTWSLDALPPPWGSEGSIYEHVKLHGSDPLPDEAPAQGESKIKWIAGAWDGVLSHHVGSTDAPQRAFDIAIAVRDLLQRPDANTMTTLYRLVVNEAVLLYIDTLLHQLAESEPPLDRGHLLELGRYLVTRSAHREAVKFGMALIGLAGTAQDVETLKLIGRNEEFTLYAANAITNVAPEPEQPLWDLAKSVRNWGRIETVERLRETQNPEIQAWMIREGFRNGVMYEYLACICARAGRLHEALKRQSVDDALLDGAADIICALLSGEPAEGIDDYAHAADACEAYINCVWSRPDLALKHFLAIADLRWFLSHAEGWDEARSSSWTETRRKTLQALCDDVFGRETWRQQVMSALSATDERTFHEGDAAAKWLSIDTWEVHFIRVKADPLRSSSWYSLMQQTDERRIDTVLQFAESVLPFEQIESGPGDEMGLGPGFEAHQALDRVLQDLRRFPNRGWRLIKAGLRSPVVRNRNMAINALSAWPRESWDPETNSVLLAVHELEPNDDVKRRLQDLLEGKPMA